MLLFCEETDHDISTSSLFKINLDDHSLEWSSEIQGGNLGLPIISNSNIYVISAGSVGKIDLNTGNYIWKHWGLYDSNIRSFNYFDTILIQGDTIEFISKQRDGADKVIVNDKTGQIIRIINRNNKIHK